MEFEILGNNYSIYALCMQHQYDYSLLIEIPIQ